ncbi:hypothetical protein TSUD_323670 [Trifolium subterraneum]|uniref:FAR1 domain-containing protein n=1 Tax=Trifolium subterraneum TaxID=3900 RepID=A0A2Z6P6Q1_TRISU|nr:hypothetical protein TSUD_323670 [Trifolium subterraneum]
MENNVEEHMHMDESVASMEGLEDLSVGVSSDEAPCDTTDDDAISVEASEGTDILLNIDSMEDILSMNLKGLSPHETRKFHFSSLEMAYEFYNRYARMNEFSVRKSKILYNKKGEILQRTFVCHKQGFKEDKGLTKENRKRERKPETRTGCDAKFRVHIDILSQR